MTAFISESRQKTTPEAPRTSLAIYGSPVAHSVSPAVHNHILSQLGLPRFHYGYSDNPTLTDPSAPFHSQIRAPESLGGSITMPLKLEVIDHVDDITEEAKIIGAVNTLYWRTTSDGKEELIGTALDQAGVGNPLLAALVNHPSPFPIGTPTSFAPGKASAVCIGAGGAARAAVYALHSLGFSPIYVLNRTLAKVDELAAHFSEWDIRKVESVEALKTSLAKDLEKGIKLVGGVSAVPCVEPVPESEKLLYEIATAALESIYEAPAQFTSEDGFLALPSKRVFLEMTYKPRDTLLRKIADRAGWETICGVESVLEVCFEQSYLWTGVIAPMEVREGARKIVR